MQQRLSRIMAVALALALVFSLGPVLDSEAQSKRNPCNPCAAKGKLNPCNPCAAKAKMNPCNPCAAKKNPCNPCAAKGKLNPCNPCAAKAKMNPCNPCAAKNPCGAVSWVDPKLVARPAGSKAYTGNHAQLVKEGERLWQDRSLGQSGLACGTCHLNFANLNPTFVKTYPHQVAMPYQRSGITSIALDEMVQFCMVVPMSSKPLAWDSQQLAALTAYAAEVQKGYVKAAAANPCMLKKTATNPCNPCAAKANPCNPCAAKANPCNPCAAKTKMNPCAAKKNPCNPCGAKMNPCNPCAAKKVR